MPTAQSTTTKRGTDWWSPPLTATVNSPIPYVAPIVEDALSAMEQRILRVITNQKMGARKVTAEDGGERGYICDPGGYGRIARNAACCRKTAYNIAQQLQQKKIMRVHAVVSHGGQRVKTIYFVPHYGDVLQSWRSDPTIFKTARGSVVVRGRARRIFRHREPFEEMIAEMPAEDRRELLEKTPFAEDWQLDPARAPRKGCGRGRDPETADRNLSEGAVVSQPRGGPPAPVAQNADEELAVVLEALQSVSRANIQDALDLIAAARSEQQKFPWTVDTRFILGALKAVAGEYKPSQQFPVPKPKWLIEKMPGAVGFGMSNRRKWMLEAPVGRMDREARIEFLVDAASLLNSRLGSPQENECCARWLKWATDHAPEEFSEAEARFFDPPAARSA